MISFKGFSKFGLTLLLFFAMAAAPVWAGENYKVDTGHSAIIFAVKHFGIAPNYGRFNEFEGKVNFDEADPTAASFEITINTSSIDTHHEKRDKHLRSPDFFNSKQFPKATFKSSKIVKSGDGWKLHGDFTMLGKTVPVSFDLTHTGAGDDPWGNFRRGFQAVGSIKRSDFGMKYGIDNGALDDEVKLTIALELIRG